MKYAIVTGVSKGLGESIAKLFIDLNIHVIGLSRSTNNQLENHGDLFTHISCDLANINTLDSVCDEISDVIFWEEATTVYLVNNAATVEPIAQSMHIKTTDLTKHVNLNTIAPMAITNYFLKKTTEKGVQLISVVITSGAAEKPSYGWSAYCSTKASVNMYTKTAALEQEELENGHKIIAFSPGIMDTNMQEKIRSSSEDEFADVEKFKEFKDNNLLKDTDLVGGVVVDILTDDDVENGKIYHVRDYV
ncbi:(S)-benzoin forming benzil reductase [Oceanobacillus profundus]|uniref:(S)-benzoin forming benzil reductase n=1 Tax=Oceanobacillus TaxID=182709 RepID=UPI0026E18D2B|nr:(S)-benzoin forming benzil reductase [Oceanobacillus profundus]MBR3118689.1 (S)-benzoin forming benzil reductase [Oceanobacillus sp.]MDO6450261.1 (S)-benzoin forming benzil reductase [Oceanobacillus profundus]